MGNMFIGNRLLTRSGRLSLGSFLCFVGGFSMGSWFTLFQLQNEKDLFNQNELSVLNTDPPLVLNILVLSAPSNFDRRDTLRKTWLRLNPDPTVIKHYFLVGSEGLGDDALDRLKREQTITGDLIILNDLVDSYDNLTRKLIRGFVHLTSPFKYLLKCDDDSFVRIDKLYEELIQKKEEDGGVCQYWGYFDGRARVQKKGKWKEEEYNLCDSYIPYALGGGYILSKKCVDFVVKNQEVLLPFRNEDVSVGTWLAGTVHEKKHDVRFDTEYVSRGCNNNHLIQHKIKPVEMMERYSSLIKSGPLCPVENRRRPFYKYDWNVPPSKCCRRDETNAA